MVIKENPLLPALRRKAMQLPLRPGVYIMKDDSGKIIYIGKAKALKNRVSSYFGSQARHSVKVLRMVEKVRDFDYIVTDSEYEALVLECSLIKLHSPRYNILLKDDKGYHYIRITNELYPRISVVKQKADDDSRYLGPFVSGYNAKQSVEEAQRIFRLPTCTRRFPQEIGKGRPCLNYSIKQCIAPCRGNITPEEYAELIAQALEFLQGGTEQSERMLTERMEQCAEHLEFEKAAQLRDRIAALRRMSERQKVYMSRVEEQDIFAFALSGDESCCTVLRFLGGRLVDSEQFMLGELESLEEARSQILRRFYSMRDRIPPRIALDGDIEDRELLEEWLSDKAGRKVSITVPQRGEQYKLVEMCRQNAAEHLSNPKGRQGTATAAVNELMRLLGLPKPPEYIESYDISNMGGSNNVAGMVVFENGVPLKNAYRRFKIKTVVGQDDYASMREVIVRRINEYQTALAERNSTNDESDPTGFARLPDLILLDGGAGHVSAIAPIIEASGLPIALFGMVKDDRHRTRAITANGSEISINGNRAAFTLISTIQEEVHRFAISYHRQQRGKSVKSSSLTQIEGIGDTRAKALLRAFRTIAAIKQATVDELAGVQGMNIAAARKVYEHYHRNDTGSL